MPDLTLPTARRRRDRCPGVTRPWLADDGALVRLRLVGGALPAPALLRLSEVSQRWGDGDVHLTARANLQLRALPHDGDRLTPPVAEALAATGLVPAPSHDLVRNVMVSPQSGLAGGRADLRPVAALLDSLLRADDGLTALPGRFLLTLDDGRGDLVSRSCDLGLVALSHDEVQLRIGSDHWGPVVPLDEAAARLTGLARAFQQVRGGGDDAAWHVDDLPAVPDTHEPDPRLPSPSGPPPFGDVVPGLEHLAVEGGACDRKFSLTLPEELVATPWKSFVTGVPIPPPPVDDAD